MELEIKQEKLDYKKVLPQLDSELLNYDTLSNSVGASCKNINVTKVFCRNITLSISALGRVYGIRDNSSFGIIDELKKRGLINESQAQRLSLAVAVACHIRMSRSLSEKTQEDNVYGISQEIGLDDKFQELNRIVNVKWLIQSLVTSDILHLLLDTNVSIVSFDGVLLREETNVTLTMMTLLGLTEKITKYGENFLKMKEKISVFDGLGLLSCCAYYFRPTESMSTRQFRYKRCLETLNQMRKKIEKPNHTTTPEKSQLALAKQYDDLINKIRNFEARCQLGLVD